MPAPPVIRRWARDWFRYRLRRFILPDSGHYGTCEEIQITNSPDYFRAFLMPCGSIPAAFEALRILRGAFYIPAVSERTETPFKRCLRLPLQGYHQHTKRFSVRLLCCHGIHRTIYAQIPAGSVNLHPDFWKILVHPTGKCWILVKYRNFWLLFYPFFLSPRS